MDTATALQAEIEVLTAEESRALRRAEDSIAKGSYAIYDALVEIRDRRLYRAQYGTFEDYCRERLGFSRSRAYELIDAARVRRMVAAVCPPMADKMNGRQLRALSGVSDDAVRETVRRAESLPGKTTAAKLETVKAEVTGKPRTPKAAPAPKAPAAQAEAPAATEAATEAPAAQAPAQPEAPAATPAQPEAPGAQAEAPAQPEAQPEAPAAQAPAEAPAAQAPAQPEAPAATPAQPEAQPEAPAAQAAPEAQPEAPAAQAEAPAATEAPKAPAEAPVLPAPVPPPNRLCTAEEAIAYINGFLGMVAEVEHVQDPVEEVDRGIALMYRSPTGVVLFECELLYSEVNHGSVHFRVDRFWTPDFILQVEEALSEPPEAKRRKALRSAPAGLGAEAAPEAPAAPAEVAPAPEAEAPAAPAPEEVYTIQWTSGLRKHQVVAHKVLRVTPKRVVIADPTHPRRAIHLNKEELLIPGGSVWDRGCSTRFYGSRSSAENELRREERFDIADLAPLPL